jgi:hypothetical protein
VPGIIAFVSLVREVTSAYCVLQPHLLGVPAAHVSSTNEAVGIIGASELTVSARVTDGYAYRLTNTMIVLQGGVGA